jgi:hypothetical protein
MLVKASKRNRRRISRGRRQELRRRDELLLRLFQLPHLLLPVRADTCIQNVACKRKAIQSKPRLPSDRWDNVPRLFRIVRRNWSRPDPVEREVAAM